MIFLIITASLLRTLQLRNMMEHIKKYIINPPHTQKVRMNTLFLQIKSKPSLKNKTPKKYYAKYETSPF